VCSSDLAPLTIRIPYGGGIGTVEHHSESPEVYFTHTAGLRVVSPGTPSDAYWMIQQAVALDDPVIFLEPKHRYWDRGEVDVDTPPDLPLDRARITRPGTDVTLVTFGAMLTTALQAADIAAGEGHSLEVIDLRSLSPLDVDTIEESVRRTGRLVVAQEAPVNCGLGAEIAAQIAERCFYQLESPVLRVGGFDIPYPPAKLEAHHLPDPDRILDAVDRSLAA
jgi:pyruvate dehydrogenase E1 component beta subunit